MRSLGRVSYRDHARGFLGYIDTYLWSQGYDDKEVNLVGNHWVWWLP